MLVGGSELGAESDQLSLQALVLATGSSDLGLGGSQVSGGSLGGGHDFVELGLVPSISVLSSGGLHDGFVFATDVTESKSQLVGEGRGESIRAQVDGHQGLDLLFVHVGQEGDLVILGREEGFKFDASDNFGISGLLGSRQVLLEGGDLGLKSADLSLHGGDVLGQEVDLGISLRDHLLQFGDILLGDEMGLVFSGVKSRQFSDLGLQTGNLNLNSGLGGGGLIKSLAGGGQFSVIDGAEDGVELLEFDGQSGDDSLKSLVVGFQETHALNVGGESVVKLLKGQLLLLTRDNDGSGADGELLGKDGTAGTSESHRLHLQSGHLAFASSTCSSASTGTSSNIDASCSDSRGDSSTESKTGKSSSSTSGGGSDGTSSGTSSSSSSSSCSSNTSSSCSSNTSSTSTKDGRSSSQTGFTNSFSTFNNSRHFLSKVKSPDMKTREEGF